MEIVERRHTMLSPMRETELFIFFIFWKKDEERRKRRKEVRNGRV